MAVVLSINAMEDMHKTRGIAYNPNISKGPFAANKQQMYNTHARLPFRAKNSVDELTGGFSGMNLQGNGYAGSNARAAPQMSSHSSAIAPNMPFLYNGGHVGFNGNMYMPQHGLPFQAQPGNAPFYGYPQPNFGGEYSPNAWMPPSRVPSGDVPSLVAPRRDSSSSHENDLPGTPFSHYTGYGNGGVAIMDNSPNSVYAYSTPSPIQARFGGITKQPMPVMCPEHLQALALRKPAIPVAVPAPFSPQKPLEQRLVNKHGITNVYLRGLQPDTTDEMLFEMAQRFGEIDSSKAIIDHDTGLCKGFGFVKYFSFKDAENCIRAFTWRGYETSFARESFYSQLKKLSEPGNTNLYISNLPKALNEHELAEIFHGFKVQSARILRNGDGTGRGVGFARFESRDICETVIQTFNNTALPKPEYQDHIIQIRYADTPEQKALKQSTTAARQYRTAEYESQTRPQQIVRRFPGPAPAHNGPMTPSTKNHLPAMSHGHGLVYHQGNGYSPANGYNHANGNGHAHGRFHNNFMPVADAHAGGLPSPADSAEGEDPTITAAMTAPGTHEDKANSLI